MILSDPVLGALAALAHVLVLVYWLGGDLGAFYASLLVSRASETPSARAAAGRILNAVDMAPRTAMILALPTGASLAAGKGWILLPDWGETFIWLGAVAWTALIWRLHAAAASPTLRALDLGLRIAFLAGLFSLGAFASDWPLFIRLKCVLLGLCVAFGLGVRGVLAPFGAAFAEIIQGHSTPDVEAALRRSLGRARLFVVGIWIALLSAAYLGLWTPV
jgi:hypothetical protein